MSNDNVKEKHGHMIENGMIVDYPATPWDSIPLDPPTDTITIWVGKADFYYTPFGYKPDEKGYIHVPVTSQFAKDAGVKDGISLITAKKRIDEYVGEKFMTEHYAKMKGV
jgi:hypothetical protein